MFFFSFRVSLRVYCWFLKLWYIGALRWWYAREAIFFFNKRHKFYSSRRRYLPYTAGVASERKTVEQVLILIMW